MKMLVKADEPEKILELAERKFEDQQLERKNRMEKVKEELDKWRQPKKLKVVLSRKYR